MYNIYFLIRIQYKGYWNYFLELALVVLFSDYLLDPDFYNQAQSRGQTLIVAGVKDFPLEITNGIRMDQQDLMLFVKGLI